MSWKNDENIFHQKCTKQYCMVTESVSIDACDEITLIHVKKNKFFMFVDYYRDSNSKCMHYIIALQKRVSL